MEELIKALDSLDNISTDPVTATAIIAQIKLEAKGEWTAMTDDELNFALATALGEPDGREWYIQASPYCRIGPMDQREALPSGVFCCTSAFIFSIIRSQSVSY